MLNKKGFTLIELLAVMVVLGVLMAMTVPNIIGITTANRQQTYAEDARKMVSTAEYLIRGDDTMIKPDGNDGNHCVVMNLAYIGLSEFETTPYGGVYDPYESYVVMQFVTLDESEVGNFGASGEYKYYVQLYERLPEGEGWRGIKLTEVSKLEGDGYLDVGLNETAEAPYLVAANDNTISPKRGSTALNSELKKKKLLFGDMLCTYGEFTEGICDKNNNDLIRVDAETKKYLAGRIYKDGGKLCGTYGTPSIKAYYLASGRKDIDNELSD